MYFFSSPGLWGLFSPAFSLPPFTSSGYWELIIFCHFSLLSSLKVRNLETNLFFPIPDRLSLTRSQNLMQSLCGTLLPFSKSPNVVPLWDSSFTHSVLKINAALLWDSLFAPVSSAAPASLLDPDASPQPFSLLETEIAKAISVAVEVLGITALREFCHIDYGLIIDISLF